MESVKFELGFNFKGKAGWKIIPHDLQTNTNGFEYYWVFEQELNNDVDIENVNNYIDGFINFLMYSFSCTTQQAYDDFQTVYDCLVEQCYLEPMDFHVGGVYVKYSPNFDVDAYKRKQDVIRLQENLEEYFNFFK